MTIARPLTWTACVFVLAAAARPAPAAFVTFQYEARVATVVGTPFGVSPALGTVVTGFFTYNTDTPDSSPGDPQRGLYLHTTGGAFRAEFLGQVVTGSAAPRVEVENITVGGGTIDTFRYIDGAPQGRGLMSLNGTPDPTVALFTAFTDGTGGAFASDALPDPFPFARPPLANPQATFPNTFSLSDGRGTLLLQLNTLSQQTQPGGPVVPEPASLGLLGLGAAGLVGCRWKRRRAA